MHAAVTTQYGQVEWLSVPDPQFGPHEALVQVSHAGICGSDQHIFTGSFAPRTQTPLIQGHEFAGTVVAVGKELKGFQPGDRVAIDPIIWCGNCPACKREHFPACTSLKITGVDMDGGFGELVKVEGHQLYRLPDSVSLAHGAMVEVYGVAYHTCNRAGVKAGDNLVVWGGGKVGQCILQAARTITDAPIYLVDVLPERLRYATEHYDDIIPIGPEQADPAGFIKEHSQGGADIAIEVVGHGHDPAGWPNPVAGCVKSIRGAGTVCVLGLGDEPVPVLFKDLIWGEAKIVASRVSIGECVDAIHHLAQGNLQPDALITARMHPSQAQSAYQLLDDQPTEQLKILLEF